MIINGGSRSNWRFFAKHLMKTTENEQVRIAEIRGLAADTVLDALREMDALASGTRCKNFFYHANLNPRAEEVLTEEQWDQAVDRLEEELHLVGHSRVVVEHDKEGRRHRHVLWSRIDTDRMVAVSDSRNFAAHERAARALEGAFGHASTTGAHGKDGQRPKRRSKNWETFRGHETGVDPDQMRREVTALWHASDTAQAFRAGLEENGYRLCRGDRRDFCLVDSAGDVHSLARRLSGVKAAEIRARLASLADTVPDIQVTLAALKSTGTPAEAQPTAKTDPVPNAIEAEVRPAASPLEQFARKVQTVMHRGGGQPHIGDGLTWIERAVTVLDSVRTTTLDWLKARWQGWVDRERGGPDTHHGMER